MWMFALHVTEVEWRKNYNTVTKALDFFDYGSKEKVLRER